MKLYKTEEWHEDFGDCIFFNFINFEQAPEACCSSPLSSDFEEDQVEGYWTHFVRLDFNDIFDQARKERND